MQQGMHTIQLGNSISPRPSHSDHGLCTEVAPDTGQVSVQTLGLLSPEGSQETRAQVYAEERWDLRWGGALEGG